MQDSPLPTPGGAAERSERLDELVFECLERMEREGRPALEELCAAHPAFAGELRARMRVLCGVGLIEPRGVEESFPERLGDFRLKRRLGAGGMGVVYLAEQTSLGREVALKLIRPEQLYFPGARERFRREVEAIARLGHPGIVPVHTVGEEQGLPYFAMELVAGASLDEVIAAFQGRKTGELHGTELHALVARLGAERGGREQPRPEERVFSGGWVTACLWIARELAQALEHAHQRGVLHRDLKPSNVMLTPGGRTLLLDFGLASTRGAQPLTRTGSQAGSLPYMAPEQVRGESARIDARTDVYGLGVTLYEMLALGPPYSGTSTVELSQRIVEGRAQLLRARVPGLARDVETVVATAMALEPERRYASAADLARDLSNLLERRPIEARPAGLGLRALRWVQRHPAGATACALGFTLVVGGPLLYASKQRELAAEQRRLGNEVTLQRDQARVQKQHAESNFAKALAAVDAMLTKVGDERLKDVPRAAELRRELLEQALAFYQGFLAEHPSDSGLAAEVVRAQLRCAGVSSLLGRSEEAEQGYESALAGLTSPALTLEPRERLLLRAEATRALAHLRLASDRSEEAEATLRDGLNELDEAAGRVEPDALRSASVGLRRELASVLQASGRTEEAEAELEELLAQLEDELADTAESAEIGLDLVHVLVTLGSAELAGGRLPDARVSLERALELLEPIAAARSEDVQMQADLARLHSQLAKSYSYIDRDLIESHAAAAQAVLEGLASNFPELPGIQMDLAAALTAAGYACFEADDFEGAHAFGVRAAAILEQLVAAHPEVAEYHLALATSNSNRFAVEYNRGEMEVALACLDRAEAELAHCLKSQPDRPELVEVQIVVKVNRANALLALGRHQEAVEAVSEIPAWPRWREYMGAAYVCVEGLRQLAADTTLSPEEAAGLDQRYRARALELLREGLQRGFPALDDLREGETWAPLRDSPEFAKLLEGLSR